MNANERDTSSEYGEHNGNETGVTVCVEDGIKGKRNFPVSVRLLLWLKVF